MVDIAGVTPVDGVVSTSEGGVTCTSVDGVDDVEGVDGVTSVGVVGGVVVEVEDSSRSKGVSSRGSDGCSSVSMMVASGPHGPRIPANGSKFHPSLELDVVGVEAWRGDPAGITDVTELRRRRDLGPLCT